MPISGLALKLPSEDESESTVITADEGQNKRFLIRGLLIFDNKRSNSESDEEGEESRLENFERDMAALTATDTCQRNTRSTAK